jgi:NIMA (never in mitosis gene a)-related kinase
LPYYDWLVHWLDGGDLNQEIKSKQKKNQRIPEDDVLDYLVQICLGLKHIHDQRILHRDLKASNIFICRKENRFSLKIGDFGIARELSDRTRLVQTRIGTPYYLSPEIIEGRCYDAKSDMWALGCLLYELCCLKHAFSGEGINQLALNIAHSQPAPLPLAYSRPLAMLQVASGWLPIAISHELSL